MVVQKRYGNSILRRLPANELSAIQPELTRVELSKGTLLFEPDTLAGNVYFPQDCVISFVGDTGEGGTIEVWAVGPEGIAGFSSVVGRTKPFRGVVQIGGTALTAKAGALRRHFQKRNGFHDAVVAYYQFLLIQVSYLGICNNSHGIEQRFCRWLLMMQDRARTRELKFTQDAIAGILGTRRATISVAAAALQAAGLIRYSPGSITIESRQALENAACGCYRVIRSHGR